MKEWRITVHDLSLIETVFLPSRRAPLRNSEKEYCEYHLFADGSKDKAVAALYF